MTPEQEDLARAVRSVVDREPEKPWPALCEIGVPALAVSEHFGGLGAGVRELQIVAGELARGLTPAPLLGATVLATTALLTCEDDLVPALADGSRLAALAWVGADGGWDPAKAACTTDGSTVDGTAHYVLDAEQADVLLVLAATDTEVLLFEVERDAAQVRPAPSMDQTRRLATVTLDHSPARLIGRPDMPKVRDTALAVLAAEQAAAAAEALRLTVEYTKVRKQFGRPIGGFQALKHRMADMHVLVESARSAAVAAGEALDGEDPDASRAALVARVHCSRAYSVVAAEMIQLHGGIGFTWEHDAHRYFKHAHSTAQLLGTPGQHLARLTGELR